VIGSDGGAHWRPVEADPLGGGRFLAELTFPRLAGTSGLVGLRVEAWDADGNRTVQTVSNAFGLAAR
jgi:hypothetical protein